VCDIARPHELYSAVDLLHLETVLVGDLVLAEFEGGNLLPEHEVQSAESRFQRQFGDNNTPSSGHSLVGGSSTGLGNPIPSGGGGEDAHTSEQPADLALKVGLVGVDHVRVDDVNDQTEELVAHVAPRDDPRS